MSSTYNNHCPIKGDMKEEGEGVLLSLSSPHLCVSITLSPELCVPANAIVIFLPASHPPARLQPWGGASTFWENIKHLWQPVIKPSSREDARGRRRRREGGMEWKTEIIGARWREPPSLVLHWQLRLWEMSWGKLGSRNEEWEKYECVRTGEERKGSECLWGD